MAMTLSGSNGVTFNDASLQGAAASPYVLKNRIINGAMVIDQRNAGASLTITANPQYNLDRWQAGVTLGSKISIQQNAGSVTPPAGFSNYMGINSLANTTPGTSDVYYIQQSIEGLNVADLAFGTASAKTITLSFWVYSNLTGTFGGAVLNAGSNRSYPFNYTISSANTWTNITVTIPGDTTGTWLTTNSVGLALRFGLGAGSTYQGVAGAWGTTNAVTTTTATNVLASSSNYIYFTGVQLEIGTSATPFERRLYNQELANCQRYFLGLTQTSIYGSYGTGGSAATSSSNFINCQTPVTLRSTPTVTYSTLATSISGGSTTVSAVSVFSFGQNLVQLQVTGGTYSNGQSVNLQNNASAGYLQFSAEL